MAPGANGNVVVCDTLDNERYSGRGVCSRGNALGLTCICGLTANYCLHKKRGGRTGVSGGGRQGEMIKNACVTLDTANANFVCALLSKWLNHFGCT